jgi:hypothetical protein
MTVRLEVVGALSGTLVGAGARARVINISRNGALIVCPVAAPVDSVQTIHIGFEGPGISLQARARHLSRVDSADSEKMRYRIGLEFLYTPGTLLDALG